MQSLVRVVENFEETYFTRVNYLYLQSYHVNTYDYETLFIYFIDDACYAGYHGANDDCLQCGG